MKINSLYHQAIATVLGAGYFPKAPGTFASLVTMPLIYYLHSSSQNYLIVLILVAVLGTISASHLEKQLGKDPSIVVVDEMLGMLIAFYMIDLNMINGLLGFSLFRLFDIFKPLGIKKLEHIGAGIGIMADDALAGLFTLGILHLIDRLL